MSWEQNPTEEGWHRIQNPGLMLKFVRKSASARRLRLATVACCRAAWPYIPPYFKVEPSDEECHKVLDLSERFADGTAKYTEMTTARRALAGPDVPRGGPQHPKVAAVWFASAKDPVPACTEAAARLLGMSWSGADELEMPSMGVRSGFGESGNWPAACLGMVAAIRDVFGNPFREAHFDRKWRTDTALSLAKQMYESRDFSAMPILADALQDAGCDNEDILSRCRGEGPHVRGCWVVDLVLGKE